MEDVRIESCISIQLFSLSVSCLMFYFQLGVLRTLYLYYKMHLSSGYEMLKMPVSDTSFPYFSFLCARQIVIFSLGVAVRQADGVLQLH